MWKLEVGGRHGSLPFSLLFFLRVVFVLKFLLFERGQADVVGITKSLVLWLGLSSPLPCLPLPSERENTEKQAPPRHLILSYGRCRRVRAYPLRHEVQLSPWAASLTQGQDKQPSRTNTLQGEEI